MTPNKGGIPPLFLVAWDPMQLVICGDFPTYPKHEEVPHACFNGRNPPIFHA